MTKAIATLSVFAAFFVLVACGTKTNSDAQPTQSDFPIVIAVQPTHDPKRLSDGVWKVGLEIEPGTYTTIVPNNTPGCYWGRLKNFLNEKSSVIAQGLLIQGARGRVTIKASDVGVEFTGECVWEKES